MSTFASLNTATTALWAQRRGLDVTGQNIANVNTEGYSRQRVNLQAIGGSTVPAFFSTSSGLGQGVSADDVTRIRDAFLEGRGHTEHANGALLAVETETFERIQTAFREPGDTGIQTLLTEVWDGWEDVANQPDTAAARAQLIQRMGTLIGGIQSSDASLKAQWVQTRENLDVVIKDVNAAAASIAQLNDAIRGATHAGLPANDLKDQRDVLVMKLADQVGAAVRPGDDGMLDVSVGGMSLVSGSTVNRFTVAGPTDSDLVTGTARPRVVTTAGNYPVAVNGTAGGQLSALTTIIPKYRTELNELAGSLAETLNAGQAGGFDLGGAQGQPILGPAGTVTAGNITLMFTEPSLIAASKVTGAGNFDNSNADAIGKLRHEPAGVDAGYRKMIVELGVQAGVTIRNNDIQSVITTQVDAAREAVAGVNLDEELTTMLSFQHAYAAASRMVTAIDEALETLIKSTGLVGR